MQFRSLKVNDLARFKGEKSIFIVTCRNPEDRSSGSTEIMYESGGTVTYLWDYFDPEVEYLGKGKLEVKITKVSD